MIGILPAAGTGTRLGLPFPKELLPVVTEDGIYPVSEFILSQLTQVVSHVAMVINGNKAQVMQHYGDGSRHNCHLSYVVQEQPGGLARAIDAAYHLAKDQVVFFGMPDTIIRPEDVFVRLKAEIMNNDLALAAFQVTDTSQFGMLEMDGDQVVRIDDKPASTNLVYAWGCMCWRPKFSTWLHESLNDYGMTDLDQIINTAILSGYYCKAVRMDGYTYQDLGTHGALYAMQKGSYL